MRLREFAPSPDRDDSDKMPNELLVLANRWWNATDRQPQIEHVLNSLGWSIHQVESEDDAVQLQHRDGTTYFISADDFDPDLFEISDELRRDYLHHAGRHVDRRLNHMARVRDRLNKGYEIYHADRPAGPKQIVDRFDADTPALARQYYEKFIHDYVSDVDFDLRLRRATGIIEEARMPAEVEDFLYDLTPDDAGVDEVGPYRIHYEGFTDDCQSSADYCENPEAVYNQVFADHIAREGGRKPVKQNFTGDEDYPILYSIFKIPSQVKEIARLPKSEIGDWGDKGTLADPKHPIKTKPLPGGSKFRYAVNKTGTGDIEIMIFDGNTLAAEMDLFDTQDFMKTWRVETVVVDPDYRGQGLGKALYGIALSILKLTIEAGESQTRHGQQMWLMLNSIPGVEVVGYNMTPTDEYNPQRGDKVVDQNERWTRYTFPVKPGTSSMRSGRRGTGIYTSQASMIAKWTGR
jgi:GNAT superfamily N-acetyltransferase